MDVIVFWSRNPRPLFDALDELDARGYRTYFQYTVMDNPRTLDPMSPPLDAALTTFQALAARIGPERMIWRYDPIVLSDVTDAAFHLARYARSPEPCGGTPSGRLSASWTAIARSKAPAYVAEQGIDVTEDDPTLLA